MRIGNELKNNAFLSGRVRRHNNCSVDFQKLVSVVDASHTRWAQVQTKIVRVYGTAPLDKTYPESQKTETLQ